MLFSAWRRWLRDYSRLVRGRVPRRSARPRRRTLLLEPLEDRTLLSTSIPLNALTWTSIGPQPVINGGTEARIPSAVSGRVDAIAASPTDPNTFYVGAADGGVWKTTDGGQTYIPLTDHLTDGQGNRVPEFMGSLAIDPKNENIVYAGTGDANGLPGGNFQIDGNSFYYGMGILKSADGGQTWQVLNPGGVFTRRAIAKIIVDPGNDQNVYAAVVATSPGVVNSDTDAVVNGLPGNTGIWKSTDGGTSWTNTTAAAPNNLTSTDAWSDLVMDPQNPQVLYAAVGNPIGSASNGVYETTDAGVHWTLLSGASAVPGATSGGRIALAIAHPASASKATLYAVVSDPAFFALQDFDVSVDGGKTWKQKTKAPNFLGGQGFYDIAVAVDPNNPQTIFAGGQDSFNFSPPPTFTGGIVESTDGGNNWTDLTNGTRASLQAPHTDHHALAFDAAGNVLNGNDGGVWRFSVAGNEWTDLNAGLDTLQFEGAFLNPIDPNIVFGGAQDNGTNEFDNSLGWKQIQGGDGGPSRVDPTNINGPGHPATIYQEFTGGTLQRSDNGGSSFTDITPTNGGGTNFYNTYALDPSTPGRILYGSTTLLESLDYGTTWKSIGSFSVPPDALAVAPSDPKTIYVSAGGQISVTPDDGKTWSSSTLSPALAAGTVTIKGLAADPTDPTIVYAVVANFTGGAGQVFEGQTVGGTTTWTNISALAGVPSADLPDVPADSIVIDPTAGDKTARTIYVGTDAGVFFTQDSGGHWHPYGVGLPNAQISSLDLSVNPALGLGGILLAGTYGRGAWEVIPQDYAGGITLAPQEGTDAGAQVVAHFIDAAGQPAGANYSASISWGDGTTTPAAIAYNAGTGLFDVAGDHLYAEEGAATVTVTIDKGAAATTVTSLATVIDPAAAVTAGATLTATEGTDSGPLTVATFTDPGGIEANGDYTATINWGDGASATGTVSQGGGLFAVAGDHTYAEEGNYPVTVTVRHDAAPATSVTGTLSVADAPVTPAGGLTVSVSEGVAFHNAPVATFTDPGGAEALTGYSATIDWGDGSSAGAGLLTYNGAAGSPTGQFTVEGTHKYAEDGAYTVTVVVSNDGSNAQTVTSSASVADLPISARGVPFSVPEGSAPTGTTVATFTDPGGAEALSDYTATIDWGDGTSATGGAISYDSSTGIFSVVGGHAYGEEGSSFPVTVKLTHDGLPTVTVSSIARVTDAAVAVTGGLTLTPAEGASFGPQAVATFTDPGGAEVLADYSASIDWGDGATTTGSIAFAGSLGDPAAAFTILGSHAYTEEGAHTVTALVHHDTAPLASASSTAAVVDLPVSATGGFSVTVTEGAASSPELVATFTDPGGAEAAGDYTATINWGDNTSSAGTVSGPDAGGTFSVKGGHSYAEEGSTFALSVTVGHEGTAAATVAGTATVVDGPVNVTGGLTVSATEATASGVQTVATFTDPGGPEATGDYAATIDWGDGTSAVPGTISGPDSKGVFRVSGGHTYAQESPAGAPYAVTVGVSHDVAPLATGLSSAVVSDPAVQLTAGATVTAVEGADSGPQAVATFTDPAGSESTANYSATVAWGDGTSSAGTIAYDSGANAFTVSADHTYAENGAFAPRVTVHHGTAADVSGSDAATVSDPPVLGQGGFVFTGVRGFLSSSQVVATFTDPGGAEPVGDYGASIDWGDGSTNAGTLSFAGVLADPAGTFSVTGSHNYATPGDHPLRVTIRHESAVTVTVPDSTAVSELPVVASGGLVLTAIESVASALQPVASFTDPAGAEGVGSYSATIDWHDGTTSAGIITYSGAPGSPTGTFTVLGSHAYRDGASPPVTVVVHHNFAPDVTVQSSSSVTPVLNLLEVLPGEIHRVGHHNHWVQTFGILNLTGMPLSGRFVIVLDGLGLVLRHGKLRRNHVVLLHPTGMTPGPMGALSPFVVMSFDAGTLSSAPGGVFTLEFSAPPKATVQYTPRLLEGTIVP